MKNKTHAFLTLPLLVSAVSLGAMTSASASMYEAKTKWSIQSEQDAGYCSASQGFNDKVYLTFAKRIDGALSLAVDFQSNKFAVGTKYAFKLRSGSISRSFKLSPSSNNAMVFPLGDDEPLVNALVETSVITLEVDGKPYNFTLRNPADLKQDLYKCIADMSPATGTPSNLVAKKGPSDLDKLKAENQRLNALLKEQRRKADAKMASVTGNAKAEETREQLFVLEKENERLSKELESLSALKGNMSLISNLQADLKASKAAEQAVQAQLAQANSQILKLESAQTPAQPEAAVDVQALEIELQEKRDQVADLTAQLTKAEQSLANAKQTADAQISDSENSDAKMQELVEKMQTQDAALQSSTARVQALSQEVATLKAALAEAQNQPVAVDAQPEVDTSKIDELQAMLADQEAEKASLEQTVLELKGQLSEKTNDTQMLVAQSQEYDALERRYKSALVDLEAIKSQNIALSDQVSILENNVVELKTTNKNMELSPDASWDLEKATRRYQEAQREIVSLGRIIEQKDQQCDMQKKEIETLLFDPEIANSEQRAELARLEAELYEKDQLIADLENQISQQNVSTSPRVDAKPENEPQDNFVPIKKQAQNDAQTSVQAPQPTEFEVIEAPEVVKQDAPQSVTAQATAPRQDIIEAVPLSEPAQMEAAKTQAPKASLLSVVMKAVKPSGDVSEQEKAGMKILRWKRGELHGTAIEKPLAGQVLGQAVNDYIDRAQSKCTGDFAAIPSLQGDKKQTYEIACVKPNGKGSSASLLFLKDMGNMITIAHEGRTELMEQAIIARDEISKTVNN